jgi:site-specific recombinase XerD
MLNDLIQQEFIRSWHRGTLFASHLDDFLDKRSAQGFEAPMLRAKLCAVTFFGDFLRSRGVDAVGAITDAHVTEFLSGESERIRGSGVSIARSALDALLSDLQEQGLVAAPPLEPAPSGPVEDFLRSLSEERGLAPATIANRRHYLGRFLQHIDCEGSRDRLGELTAKDVDRFLVEMGRAYSRKAMSHACTAVRGLLRYLYRTDVLPTDLSGGVLLPKFYAIERLPCALPWATVERILEAVDTTTPTGRRDIAVLWLLVTYGLRPGEVEKLRLDDLDWRNDAINVRRLKNRKLQRLPLTEQVGETILAYLRDGRPKTSCREVFIRAYAPHVALRRAVGKIVNRYLNAAGVESSNKGAYVIRHSFAVHLLRQGRSLKTISDMLGHTDPRSVYHYTKLAIEDLHDVALPATEVLP